MNILLVEDDLILNQHIATLLQEAYKVEGVPAIGIAGRYYTDGTRSGSMGRALQTTDALVAEARKAR